MVCQKRGGRATPCRLPVRGASRRVPVAHHLVDLLLHHFERLGVLAQRVHEPREHGGGRLVAGDQQRDEVVAHLRVVEGAWG